MARPSTITREEVFAAIRDLIAAGAYPNPAQVRAALDNRGSPPVVQRHIGAWFAEFGPELARKATAKPQRAPTEDLRAELARMTASAVQDIETAQAERIAVLDDRAAALDGRESDLLAREQAQDAREAAHAELLADLREQLATANARLSDANTRAIEEAGVYRAQVEALHAAGESREAELARLRPLADQVPLLKGAVERAQADAAREQARVVELVGERDRLQSLASDRAAELAKAKGALEQADSAAAAQNASLATLRLQLQEAQAALAAATVRCETLARDLELAHVDRRADLERIEALQQLEATARQSQARDAARIETLLAEIERVKEIGAELAFLKDEILRLGKRLPAGETGRK